MGEASADAPDGGPPSCWPPRPRLSGPGNPAAPPPPRPRRWLAPPPMIWPICWSPCWPIAPSPGPGRARGRHGCPTPAAACPACGGWCGSVADRLTGWERHRQRLGLPWQRLRTLLSAPLHRHALPVRGADHHSIGDRQRHPPGPAIGPAAPSACGSPAWSANRYKCKEIGSYARAQELLREGHTYLDRNVDGIACNQLRKVDQAR
jgi:hypothetical protein